MKAAAERADESDVEGEGPGLEPGDGEAGVEDPLLGGEHVDIGRQALAVSKPDMGPQSRPSERAARIRYAPSRLLLRNAARYRSASVMSENQPRASACGASTGSLS